MTTAVFKFLRNGNELNSVTGNFHSKEQIKNFLIESLLGGKEFQEPSGFPANINDFSNFGEQGDTIVVEVKNEKAANM